MNAGLPLLKNKDPMNVMGRHATTSAREEEDEGGKRNKEETPIENNQSEE